MSDFPNQWSRPEGQGPRVPQQHDAQVLHPTSSGSASAPVSGPSAPMGPRPAGPVPPPQGGYPQGTQRPTWSGPGGMSGATTGPMQGPTTQPGDGSGRPPGFPPGSVPPAGSQPGGAGPQSPRGGRPRRAGKLAAAVLGVAVLAAGVGGGSAYVTPRYLADDQPAAIGQSQTPTQGKSVQQADENNPNWTAVADVAERSVAAIQVATAQGGGQGSGVVIGKDGTIITNNHVVNGAQQIRVTLGSTTYSAELVGTDPETDLAVIRVQDPPKDLEPLAWGDNLALEVGDPVMAIGNPLGLSNTVTTGIVSALDRPVTTRAVDNERRGPLESPTSSTDAVVTAAIQTSAAINPGNSGGALVNGAGQLVGITSSIASLSSGQEGQSGNIGIGFAIGADQAKRVAEQLIESGKAVRPQMGVTAKDTDETGPMGAKVETVVPNSPAAKAGLQPGDVITAIGERKVSSVGQLVGIVRAQEVGTPVQVTYIRDNRQHTANVTLVAASK